MGHPWGGRDAGLNAIPRVGMQVVIHYWQGDPSKPYIAGCVHGGRNRPVDADHVGSLPGNRHLVTLKSKEIGGSRTGGQICIDDTHGQIGIGISSDHQDCHIDQGYLTTPRHNGQAQPRGEGIEARTRAAVVARGEQGVYITADPLPGATRPALERAQAAGLIDLLQSVQQKIAQLAAAHAAGTLDEARLAQFKRDFSNWEQGSNTAPQGQGGGMPMVVVSAPSTVALASGDNLLLGAQTNLDAVSAGNTQVSAGRSILLHAGEAFQVFAQAKGIQLITALDDINIESHAGEIVLTAAKRITLRAGEDIIFEAPKIKHSAQGAQVDVGDGQIVQQSSGPHIIKSSSFAQTSGGGGSVAGLKLPSTTLTTDEMYVLRMRGAGTPLVNRRYRIELEGGAAVEGRTDSQGRTQLATSQAINIASITLFDD